MIDDERVCQYDTSDIDYWMRQVEKGEYEVRDIRHDRVRPSGLGKKTHKLRRCALQKRVTQCQRTAFMVSWGPAINHGRQFSLSHSNHFLCTSLHVLEKESFITVSCPLRHIRVNNDKLHAMQCSGYRLSGR